LRKRGGSENKEKNDTCIGGAARAAPALLNNSLEDSLQNFAGKANDKEKGEGR